MKFAGLFACIRFLESEKELVRIKQAVDPDLEMAEITRRVYEAGGPAILFENVRSSPFPAVSNMFGTYARCIKIFSPQLEQVTALADLRSAPIAAVRSPVKGVKAVRALMHAWPVRTRSAPVLGRTTRISNLPRIRCWPRDGGAFIMLPQVCSQNPSKPGIMNSNIGMYRIQMSGNAYAPDREIGLHYQIHRGIADHHARSMAQGRPLKVSIFIGGPPAHTLAAVMPLPEGIPEAAFAGALAGANFRYCIRDGYLISADADFVITGTVASGQTRPEGPFGDHLGYYSMTHEFPFLQVDKVFHKPDAVFPFTVVGRPPQEDSNFGRLIHEMTRSAVPDAIPGVVSVNAVDAAGVHPLLLATAHERYVPYEDRKPREILTTAMAVLGTGQLSLAKYLLICAHEDNPSLDAGSEPAFFSHLLERIDFGTDLHFFTRTTMDTLDYSHESLNRGSKLILAAAGEKRRDLAVSIPPDLSLPEGFTAPALCGPGILAVRGPAFSSYDSAEQELSLLTDHLGHRNGISGFPLVVVVDDSAFVSRSFDNFLWVSFTRSNPSHDIYGFNASVSFKHWHCRPPMVIDARIKPFHAPPLVPDPDVKNRVDALGKKGGPLYGII